MKKKDLTFEKGKPIKKKTSEAKRREVIKMWWLKWIGTVIKVASPEIVKAAQEFAVKLRTKAMATDNPVDDILAELLCDLLKVQ